MELRLPSPTQLRAIYEAEMKSAFPPAELKPLSAIERMWQEGRYKPWCLFEGEKIVGLGFLWLGRAGWALLDYLCVCAAYRNSGLGGEILRLLHGAEPDTVIFGEAEEPSHAPDSAMAQRRLGFYLRNGLRIAGYDTDVFGVHYKTLYLAGREVADEELMAAHRYVYESSFTAEKFARHVIIPRDPALPPVTQIPWDQ